MVFDRGGYFEGVKEVYIKNEWSENLSV